MNSVGLRGVVWFLAKALLKKPISSGGPALTFEKHPKIVSQLSSESLIVSFRTSGVSGDLMFRLLIVFSNVTVDLTTSGRSFVFSQWMAFVADVILPQLGYHYNFKSC